ncbi:4-hydroxybenzoate polyprenyltransferase [Microbacterium halimionae]|uniref:4-hydroxybenzoate polyprenyltransferase n=1 Tax=Microbacterium halimionae TaxID=1526413 RepID=A0A7W3JQ44_9MICO|nr:UbiA family prenyltransferase [Microbacterium halimionae]MBA8816950.1 4-hydroxybenzoate polyprenyltransferase [Microbacterium halimionae]NII94511.1 4-hydroxybenzoate polyprenyltransferase [Microbacterium halimionae]
MARALWASSHPGPTLVVTALAVALGVAAGVDALRVVLLGAAVLFGQLSVGISNDAIDAARDRSVGRSDKPIARGDVTVRAAFVAAFVALAGALLLSAILSWGMLLAHAIALASAWSYNLRLKSTAFSVVPFLVSFGLFPSLATLSAVPSALAAPWAFAAGAALGAAVHLTNVLPDLDDDRRTGVRGLAHRIGGRPAAIISTLALAAGALAVLLGPVDGALIEVSVLSWVFFGAVIVVSVATLYTALSRRPGRIVFRLVMTAALLLAAQLVASGGALAA